MRRRQFSLNTPLLLLILTAVIAGHMLNMRMIEEKITKLEQALTSQMAELKALAETPPPETIPVNSTPPKSVRREEPTSELASVFNENGDTESTTPERQAELDALKKRFESLFVLFLYMKQCEIADQTDYHIINSSLAQEMASLNAPGRLQYDILTAAKGSYAELYKNASCDTEAIGERKTQYQEYINSLKSHSFLE